MDRLENVRYLAGAPPSFGWLSAGDLVSIATETEDIPGAVFPNGRHVQMLSALVIIGQGHVQRVPREEIRGLALGSTAPPAAADAGARLVDATIGKLATPETDLNRLLRLPREPHRWLAIELGATAMLFDVTDRHLADEDLAAEREPTLVRGADAQYVIKDGSYRWISVTEFTVPPDGPQTANDRLAVLIGHPAYWYGYMSPRVVQAGIHGPYRLEEITPKAFRPVDASAAHTVLNEWLYQYGPMADELIDGDLAAVRRAIDQATERFELPDLGVKAHHEVGWVLHSGFCELVLLGPGDAITLIVASGD